MDSASWTSLVRTSHKQDQLAESTTGQLGFSFEPLRQLQRFTTGNGSNYVMVSDPVFDAFYPKAIGYTNIADIKQVVRDANEYVVRQHFIISLLCPNVFGLYQPWLKGYIGQTESVTGTTTGPLQLGFYASRFWIDQTVKKSAGH